MSQDNPESIGTARSHRPFRLLLIDSMDWKRPWPKDHPLTEPGAWFRESLQHLPNLRLKVVHWSSRQTPWKQFPFDVCVISGSVRCVTREDQATRRLRSWIEWCLENSRRVIGICYGHQLLASVLGARIVPHPLGPQVGNVRLVTEPGIHQPPPFRDGEFFSHPWLTSHLEMVVDVPQGIRVLARSEATPVEAFSFGNQALGFQFHPEMDAGTLRFLWAPHCPHPSGRVTRETLDSAATPPDRTAFAKAIHHWAQGH